MREFQAFRYKDATYKICSSNSKELFSMLTSEIKQLRDELDNYIKLQPEFLKSLEPITVLQSSPDSAIKMAEASRLCGIGPMAAVAGTIAQIAAEKCSSFAHKLKVPEIIIENGGDLFILPIKEKNTVITGIFSGLSSKFSSLALKISPEKEGIAVCSSSSLMGHSLSLGNCDLSTVISKNASLADAAATFGGNLVKTEADLKPAAEKIVSIYGVEGVILIKNEQIAIAGNLPEIIKHKDPSGIKKITKTF
ncbi:MAG: UPF0280 family protein [Spirochaetales bacterium]|nr:UPF0280 family protein [Spirochaetales bacterium]